MKKIAIYLLSMGVITLHALNFKYEHSDQALNYYTNIVAQDDKNNEIGIISFKQNKQNPRIAVMDRIEVDKPYRQQGLGRKLVALCYDYLKKRGVKKITWFAQPDPDYSLDRLITFYEQTGARVIKRYTDSALMEINL